MSPIERIMGEPTFMAFEMSKDLPPRQEPSHSRKNSFILSKKKPAQPAKLAGLFAAMDLTLSAGAVSPVISHALHSRENKSNLQRARSLDSPQEALTKLASSISAFKPGVVGASILLPGFPNMPNSDSKAKETQQEPYYYSSAKELELRTQNRQLNGATSTATGSTTTATRKSTLAYNRDKTDGPSVSQIPAGLAQHYRSFSQSSGLVSYYSRSVSQHSRTVSQASGAASDISLAGSQTSETMSQTSRTMSQTSMSSSIVKISGITAIGEPIRLGYMQTVTNIGGDDKPIYCTKAPRPRLNHNSSISESKSVSAATGLYRTIIGELPAVLSLHCDTDTEASRPNSDTTLQNDNEVDTAANFNSSDEGTADDVTVIECVSDGQASDRKLEVEARLRSLEKLRTENEATVDFKDSNRQFINHSRTHPSVFRTSSKIRRQKPVDDNDEVFLENQTDGKNLHETVRKTKSDISNVRILNNRRMQIPVRFAKSFDTHDREDGTANVGSDSESKYDGNTENNEESTKPKRVIVSVASIKLNIPNSAKPESNSHDDYINNNINEHLKAHNISDGNAASRTSSSSSYSSSPTVNSWYCEVSSSPEIQKRNFVGSKGNVRIRNDRDESKTRRKCLSPVSKTEVRFN